MLQPITKINSAKQFSKRSIDRSALVISGGLQRIKSLSQLSDAEDNINKKKIIKLKNMKKSFLIIAAFLLGTVILLRRVQSMHYLIILR